MNTRALAVLGLALATAGCVDHMPNLFVTGVCGTPNDAVTCNAPAGSCDTYRNGSLFIFTSYTVGAGPVTNEMIQVAQVENRAVPNANDDIGRVNGRDAIIESASLKFSSPGVAISALEVPSLFTRVPAAGSATIFLPIMPAATVAEIAAAIPADATVDVGVEVRLKGHYADGSTFETGPFEVPVSVINTEFIPAGCTDPTQVRFFCFGIGQTGSSKCAAP